MKYRLYAGTINHHADEAGWENLHLDASGRDVWHHELEIAVAPEFTGNITGMPQFRDEMFDEVVCHHVLEHCTYEQSTHAVNEFWRILKHEGQLDVEVPDIDRVAQAWLDRGFEGSRMTYGELAQWLYGEDMGNPLDFHRWGWNEEQLRVLLGNAGFLVRDREVTGLALRMISVKT